MEILKKYNDNFWKKIDKLYKKSKIIIDRPKGSKHPKFKKLIYPVDYGYLKNTKSMDGNGIDIWIGTNNKKIVDTVLCIVDLLKNDSEIKLLLSCTNYEKELIYKFHNNKYMSAILIKRKIGATSYNSR